MLGPPVCDRPLAHHGVIVAGLPLALDIGPVGGLADEVELAEADCLLADAPQRIVGAVEMGEADIERVVIVDRHRPARQASGDLEFLALGFVAGADELPDIRHDDVARPHEYVVLDPPRRHRQEAERRLGEVEHRVDAEDRRELPAADDDVEILVVDRVAGVLDDLQPIARHLESLSGTSRLAGGWVKLS